MHFPELTLFPLGLQQVSQGLCSREFWLSRSAWKRLISVSIKGCSAWARIRRHCPALIQFVYSLLLRRTTRSSLNILADISSPAHYNKTKSWKQKRHFRVKPRPSCPTSSEPQDGAVLFDNNTCLCGSWTYYKNGVAVVWTSFF